MNDNDLERQLRAQRGPREDGYTPSRLPMSLEEARTVRPALSAWVRGAMFVGAAAAGVLAVAVAAAIFSAPGDNGVGGTHAGLPSPSASSPASVDNQCTPDDLTFTAEPWGGAAGSRGTSVTVTLAAGHDACGVDPNAIGAQITDANGNLLVSRGAAAPYGSELLVSGEVLEVGVAWSNWCGVEPAVPVSLTLQLNGWPSFEPVTVPAGGADPVPPCLGSNAPSSLSVTQLGFASPQ